MQQDDSLVLGDFGVATIRGDAVTCTRADSSKSVVPLNEPPCGFRVKVKI